MSLAHLTLVLLTSQATAVSMARRAADGTIDTLLSDDATAQSILEQVEQLAQSHAKVSKPKIATIQELVKSLEDALEATRKGAQGEVDRNLEAIGKCNDDQEKSIKDITETTKVTVGNERKAHADCRNKEMETHADMFQKCTALKDFLKQLESPAEPGSDDDAVVDYVVAMDKYWCPQGPLAKDKSHKCKQATDKHKAEKAKCDALQSQFELGFCTWRTELVDVCDTQTSCHAAATENYQKHKAATEELVKKWKTECVALNKISCYVQVWLKDGNEATVDAQQLEDCRSLNPSCASECHIDFKTPAEKTVCSLTDVENYPGTDGFKTVEYAQFLDAKKKIGDDALYHFINEPTACIGDETTAAPATTEATTTTAPTTTTTEANYCEQATGDGLQKECTSVQGSWIPKIQGSFATVCDAKLVLTKGTTCKNWCESKGLTCVRAQDNVHSDCKLDSRHNRQSESEEGCNQKWNNQLCQCGKA